MGPSTADFLTDAHARLTRLAETLMHDAAPRAAAWTLCEAADHVLESRLRLAMGQGIVGRCAQLRLSQRTGDARSDPRYVVDDQFNLSELAVPIVFDESLYGVLDSEYPDACAYTLGDELALLAIADRGARRLRELEPAAPSA